MPVRAIARRRARGQDRRGSRGGGGLSRWGIALAWGCLVGGGIVCGAGPAAAAEVKLSARTYGEGYMVRIPNSTDLLSRRRMVQYVNLGVYDLLRPKQPSDARRAFEDGQLHLVSSMRLRHDFGNYLRSGDDPAAQALESADGRQVDLLFAYLEGQNLGGVVDLRIGRQFEMSGLDFYAFDGGFTRIHLPVIPLAVETFAGMMVNGTHLFGFPTFETDGTQGTPRDRGYSPMAGAALALDGISWLDARVAYRRTWTPAAFNRQILDDDGELGLDGVVSQELVSLSAAAHLAGGRLSPYAALRYNLGTARLDDVSAGIHLAMGPRQSVRALYIRTIPAFDLDSIFNIFSNEAFEDLRLVFESRPSPRWTLAARSQTRIFRDSYDELAADLATTLGGDAAARRAHRLGIGGGVSAAYRRPRFALRADGYALGGEGGLRAGGNLDTRTLVAWKRLAIDGRIYGIYFDDPTRRTGGAMATRGYSIAFQAGLNLQLWQGIHLNLLGEELITNYYTSALRVLASLSADWSLRASRQR